MADYVIELSPDPGRGQHPDNHKIQGKAYFQHSGSAILSQIFVQGLCPYDRYLVYYIVETPEKGQISLEAGCGRVNRRGEFLFERHFNAKIHNRYSHFESSILAVILINPKDLDISNPITGFKKEIVKWKPLLEVYISSLADNQAEGILKEYNCNAKYDSIIDHLPESSNFEKRKNIDRAVEIGDTSLLESHNFILNKELLSECSYILLIRMRLSNAVLYLVGFPDSLHCKKRSNYLLNSFQTFLHARVAESHDHNPEGFWCKYI